MMAFIFDKDRNMPKLDSKHADKMLKYIFEEAEVEPNSIPMAELESYSNYRMERYTLQRVILIIALIVFIGLPSMFVLPDFTVAAKNESVRGLPVYEIDVTTMFKVKRVTAIVGGEVLPVYEVDGHKYTVEPIANGTMTVTVELFNGQSTEKKVSVSTVDNVAPEISKSSADNTSITLYLKDKGIGVDYDNVYAERDGEKIYPVVVDPQKGYVTFEGMDAGDVIYVMDYLENKLVIRVSRRKS